MGEQRARWLAAGAVGITYTIRTGEGAGVTRKIVEASFIGWRPRGRSSIAQFRVVMECGEAKLRRTFVLERLPRPGYVPPTGTPTPGPAMEEREVREALHRLSATFGITPPALEWSSHPKNGVYYYLRHEIAIGPRVWRGVLPTFLHEFAHALAWQRVGFASKGHGTHFLLALHDTVTAWYGDPAQYDWASEYDSIARAWRTGGVSGLARAYAAARSEHA